MDSDSKREAGSLERFEWWRIVVSRHGRSNGFRGMFECADVSKIAAEDDHGDDENQSEDSHRAAFGPFQLGFSKDFDLLSLCFSALAALRFRCGMEFAEDDACAHHPEKREICGRTRKMSSPSRKQNER